MLIEFQVGNFLSFKDTVTFSMVASEINSEDPEIDENNIFSVGKDFKLVKTAVIYGANASGKSNFAKAFSFFRHFVVNSFKEMQVTDKINVEPFRLSTETEFKPSYFEVIFLLNKRTYRYGFSASKDRIVWEWLYCTPRSKEHLLFERKNKKFKINKMFEEGRNIENKTKPNSLFLSVVAQFNGNISTRIIEWFDSCIIISGSAKYEDLYQEFTLQTFENPRMRRVITKFVKSLDLSIQNINITKEEISFEDLPKNIPEEVKKFILHSNQERNNIQTYHEKFDQNGKMIDLEEFDLETHESEGTKKLFYLSGVFLYALSSKKVLIIDELDSRLHPLITRELVQLFNSNIHDSGSGQLIFMTHDINLLSANLFGSKLFRRDQIWFTEKNSVGATDLYSLAEYDLPEDRDFESDYIRGRYGSIPFIGNLLELLSD